MNDEADDMASLEKAAEAKVIAGSTSSEDEKVKETEPAAASKPADPSGEAPQQAAVAAAPRIDNLQPGEAEAHPTPLSVTRADIPLQPLTGKEQDPAYLRVPKAPTNFAAEL